MKVVGVESTSILVLYHGSSNKPEFEESLMVHFVDFDTTVCKVALKEGTPSSGSACSFAPPTSGTSFEDNYLNSQVQAGVQCMKFLVSSLRHFVGDTVSAKSTSVVGDLHALLRRKHFDAIFIALPVETISRAEFSNSIGPEPRRTIVHPFGFPWQKGCDDRVHRITAVAGMQFAMWAPRTQARLHVVIQHHGGNFGNLSFCRRCTLNATHSPCAGRLRMRCFQDRQDCSHQCQLQRSQVSPAAGLNTHPSSCQESTQAPCQCLADAAGSTAPVSELQAPRIILPEIFQPCPVW